MFVHFFFLYFIKKTFKKLNIIILVKEDEKLQKVTRNFQSKFMGQNKKYNKLS